MSQSSILLVDDERTVRLMLRTALESDGYRVEEAGDGQQALAAIACQTPDLMLLDLKMPSVSGMSVLERLHGAQAADFPVVVLSAFGSKTVAQKATELGAADFLEKPATPLALRQAVRRVLAASGAASRQSAIPRWRQGSVTALDRARRLLCLAEFAQAEALLKGAIDQNVRVSAECFNLLGVACEAQKKWQLARKFYGKAMRTDRAYEPAQLNMRRIYELNTFGRTKYAISLGDEQQN